MAARTRLTFCLGVCPTPSCIRFLLFPRGDLQENENRDIDGPVWSSVLWKGHSHDERAAVATPQRNFACGVNCLPEHCGTDRSRLNWIKLLQLHFPTCGLNLNSINFMVSY